MADASDNTVQSGPPDLNDPFLRDPLYPAERAYVTFLRGIFRRRSLGKMRWSPDEESTGIRITGRVPILVDRNEQRPAIVVLRQPAGFGGIGLDGVARKSLLQGDELQSDLIGCSMLIHCIARSGATPTWLAMIVARHIKIFRPLLNKWGGIHAVATRLQIGAESDPGAIVQGSSYPEVVTVPVISPFHVQDTIEITRKEDADFQLVVRDITMAMKAELGNDQVLTRPRVGGSVVDASRTRVGSEILPTLNPPTWRGRPLVPARQPGQPSKPLRQTTSLDP